MLQGCVDHIRHILCGLHEVTWGVHNQETRGSSREGLIDQSDFLGEKSDGIYSINKEEGAVV